MASDPSQLLASLIGAGGLTGQAFTQGNNNLLAQQQAQQNLVLGNQQQQLQQQQIAANDQATQQQQSYDSDVGAWLSKGGDGAGLSQLVAKYPRQWQALQQSWKIKSDDQSKADLKSYGAVFNALDNGSPEVALQELQSRAAAEKAAGHDTTEIQQHIDEIKAGNPQAMAAVKGWARAQIAAANPEAAQAVGVDLNDTRYKAISGKGVFDTRTGQYVADPTGGGDPASDGSGGGGSASGGRDTTRLINTDAGGGYVPDSVKTVGQFVTFGKALNAKGAKSSSAGTYQINGSTMAEFAPKALGADWKNQPYDADAQDKVAEAIFDWAKSQPNPAAALRGRWVSLSADKAAQLVTGSWNQAKGTIAAGETGGGAGASANAGGAVSQGFGGLSAGAVDSAAAFYRDHGRLPAGIPKNDALHNFIINRSANLPANDAANPGALDADTLRTMAQQYLAGDKSVFTNLGKGVQGGANVVRLRQAIRKEATASGMNGAQIAQQMQTFNAAQKTLNAFDAGKEGGITRSVNVAIDHLDTLQNAAQALQNGNVPLFNKVAQGWAQATGRPAPSNFAVTRQIVAGEVAKVIAGGQSALSDRKELVDNIKTSASPQQLAGYIAQAKALLAGQLHGLAQQYQAGTGRNDFATRLSPRTRVALGYGRISAPPSAGGFRILQVRPK